MREIRLENLTKVFGGFKAVDNVSLTIRDREFFSFLGPSGSGKTTILRMIAGLEVPTSGKIHIGDKDVTDIPPNKREVNTIFQNYSLFPHMTVFENIAFGPKIRKIPSHLVRDQVYEMLHLVSMTEHADKYPGQLSGGEKQRVAIARALINKPKVLLLDEPLSALDLKLRQRMLVELMSIHDEVGITFIYVTHDQGEAISISDRIALMNAGRIVQTGPPGDIWECPNSLFSAYFIGDTNLFPGEVVALEEGHATIRCQADNYGFEVNSVFHSDSHALLKIGQAVTLSLRPEKIAISKIKPADEAGVNILEGYVKDILYLGTHTQYLVQAGRMEIKVFAQHKRVSLPDTFS